MSGLVLAVLVVAYLLRALPGWMSPRGVGVDHWFWKTYVETYRRERQFPPHLPQYRLDEAQWYPPLFPLLLSRLPRSWFDSWSTEIAIIIDLLRLSLLLGVAAWQSDGSASVIVLAGAVYATTPIQISYNLQLNPRGLGAVMLDGLLLMLLWTASAGGAWWGWAVVTVLGGLILLTHKMTTQVMVFVLVGTAVVYRWWELLLLLPLFVAVAVVMSRGFYWKVLVAHGDILAFWNRNWRWIGADEIRESPIYGDSSYERREKLHKKGLRGVLWHLFILFGFNPAAWIACLLVYERIGSSSPLLIYPTLLLVWLLLPCIFAVCTSLIPQLKFLGAGYLYVYNTSLMASLVLALTFEYTYAPELSTPVVFVALTLNLTGVGLFLWRLLNTDRTRVNEDLDGIIDDLCARPDGTVMCIPSNWYEIVAYRTKKPVLWGAHGYGFKRLEPLWPRLKIPIGKVIADYDVRYLLMPVDMITDAFANDLPSRETVERGRYRLHCFPAGPPEKSTPDRGATVTPHRDNSL